LAGAFLIELDRIRPDPAQPHRQLDPHSQRELTASIGRLGILQPIAVRYNAGQDAYLVIAGERRYRAACDAGLAEVPCWVQSPEAKDVLLHQVVENWQRAELHPFDLADALAELRDANGYSQKDLAQLTGKPESEVSRLLSLLKLDSTVQSKARSGEGGPVTRRHLIAVARLDPAGQRRVFEEVTAKRLTAQETERAVRAVKAADSPAPKRGAPQSERRRYRTANATVIVQFRKRDVTTGDVLEAIEDVRRQVEREASR
jgi:ParB family chromosome partitioning protein